MSPSSKSARNFSPFFAARARARRTSSSAPVEGFAAAAVSPRPPERQVLGVPRLELVPARLDLAHRHAVRAVRRDREVAPRVVALDRAALPSPCRQRPLHDQVDARARGADLAVRGEAVDRRAGPRLDVAARGVAAAVEVDPEGTLDHLAFPTPADLVQSPRAPPVALRTFSIHSRSVSPSRRPPLHHTGVRLRTHQAPRRARHLPSHVLPLGRIRLRQRWQRRPGTAQPGDEPDQDATPGVRASSAPRRAALRSATRAVQNGAKGSSARAASRRTSRGPASSTECARPPGLQRVGPGLHRDLLKQRRQKCPSSSAGTVAAITGPEIARRNRRAAALAQEFEMEIFERQHCAASARHPAPRDSPRRCSSRGRRGRPLRVAVQPDCARPSRARAPAALERIISRRGRSSGSS